MWKDFKCWFNVPVREQQHKKHTLSLVMWLEWICMQNNEMGFTWRDNGLDKYISFSVHVAMKDNEISTQEMPFFLIIQYIMHK